MITNYELTQTGDQVQEILNQAPETASDLAAEVTNRENADNALQGSIDDLENAIGTDATADTVKGRIKELEDNVGDGGTVDQRIAAVVGDAGEEYNTLGKAEDKIQAEATTRENADIELDGRVDTLEEAVGTGGSVDERISTAKSEVIGDAATDYNTLGKVEDKIQDEVAARENADTSLQGSIDDINQIINDAVVEVSMSASSTPVAAGGTSYVNITASANITFASIAIMKGGAQIGSGTNTDSLQITDTSVATAGGTSYNATFTKQGTSKTASINVWGIYYGTGDAAADGQDYFVIKSGYSGTYSIANGTLQYLWFYIPSSLSTAQPSATMGGFEFPLTAAGDVTINGVSYKAYRSTARQYAGTYSIKLA